MLKAMVRGRIKCWRTDDYPVPESLQGRAAGSHQQVGYCWLKTLDSYGFGGILADDMGLGRQSRLLHFLKTLMGREAAIP